MRNNNNTKKIDRRRKGNKTDTRKMLEGQNLCKSQTNGELYDKLKRDGQLPRFKACLQYCSSQGMDVEKALDFICSSFKGFIVRREFTRECFASLVNTYSDLSVAWGYGETGDTINTVMLKNRAFELAVNSKSIEDIKAYNDMYDSNIESAEDNRAVINFNINK